jgi:hypothetical protein
MNYSLWKKPVEESQPFESMSQPQESPQQQPLETLDANQPKEELPVQSSAPEAQPLPSEIQPLEQQQPTLSEQHAPKSTIYTQEQPRSRVKEIEQPYAKDNSIPFVLPFDSQDVTPSS